MNAICSVNDDQARRWNGLAGRAWVDMRAVVDGMFQPMADLLLAAVSAAGARAVLDVGCGTGAVSLGIAARLGAAGRCLGIDISAPMIAAAQARAALDGLHAAFLQADAQTYAFAPASFDMIVSRFGVMFFEDPVAAFGNLLAAARPRAALRLLAWRGADANPFMTTAERAAAPLLPDLPPRPADGPGQFGFADAAKVRRILEAAGWTAVDIQPVAFTCALPDSELGRYLIRFGPLGQLLPDMAEATRAPIVAAMRAAFEPYRHGGDIRFTAACWSIGARAPG
ncbi:methyltransferase domain-containing protein [Phreatobacter sp. AB_2022a]|uniref:methyltransferase domain-containing protein n=1 Tax=Phreatobacter sp. AB_2022a TaxID=3003134 RepID=UPI00228718D4|nr:methyltransferase domain-containing protein [Phreatobacter sp. AB_2022a]MCZ0733973.1 methyltransferase domain-containing protein [Phreatobacter sp. AB_2022a]